MDSIWYRVHKQKEKQFLKNILLYASRNEWTGGLKSLKKKMTILFEDPQAPFFESKFPLPSLYFFFYIRRGDLGSFYKGKKKFGMKPVKGRFGFPFIQVLSGKLSRLEIFLKLKKNSKFFIEIDDFTIGLTREGKKMWAGIKKGTFPSLLKSSRKSDAPKTNLKGDMIQLIIDMKSGAKFSITWWKIVNDKPVQYGDIKEIGSLPAPQTSHKNYHVLKFYIDNVRLKKILEKYRATQKDFHLSFERFQKMLEGL